MDLQFFQCLIKHDIKVKHISEVVFLLNGPLSIVIIKAFIVNVNDLINHNLIQEVSITSFAEWEYF
jgi:hypothetical protein